MDYYLAPGKYKNIDKSILNSVNDKIENISECEEIYAWGITTNNKCKSYSKSIDVNDRFCIYPTNVNKDVLYVGKVVGKVNNEDLSKKIWGKGNDTNYSCVVLLKDISEINISKRELYDKLNYKRICGVTKLSNYRINKMNDIINAPPYKITKSNDFNKMKLYLIDRFWNNTDYEIDIPNNKKNSKAQKKKMEKATKGHAVDINPEFPSKIVGWTGEKILYEELNAGIKRYKNYSLFEKLQLTVTDYSKANLIWFNRKRDINNPNAEDFSVGKGYDLELEVNERKLKFEVKSSINNLGIFTLTKNELIEMKNSGSSYYLIIVDNLKSNPRIRVIKNFSKLIKEDYILMSLEHKLSINQIDEEFFI